MSKSYSHIRVLHDLFETLIFQSFKETISFHTSGTFSVAFITFGVFITTSSFFQNFL
jgi:hypothetical protein